MQYTMVVPSLATDNEVETIPIATLADYRSVTPDEDFLLLMHLTQRFAGKKIVFFHSTIQGGGVALMRHALMRLFRLLSVDAQ